MESLRFSNRLQDTFMTHSRNGIMNFQEFVNYTAYLYKIKFSYKALQKLNTIFKNASVENKGFLFFKGKDTITFNANVILAPHKSLKSINIVVNIFI